MALLKREGINPFPLFINYGQLNYDRELASLKKNCSALRCGDPIEINVPDFGRYVASGLTDSRLHIVSDAFTPCRNLLFIVIAAAVAKKHNADKIVLGLLSEETALFPDQTDSFLAKARDAIDAAIGSNFEIVTPLRELRKTDVLRLAKHLGVSSYYSCHAGTEEPCGVCIACREYEGGN